MEEEVQQNNLQESSYKKSYIILGIAVLIIMVAFIAAFVIYFFVFSSPGETQGVGDIEDMSLTEIPCDEEGVQKRTLALLNAIKSGDFDKYQEACGDSLLCKSRSNFDKLKPRFSVINEFTVREVKDWGNNVISVYFNEKVEYISSFEGRNVKQSIGVHYDLDGCKLKQFEGGVV